MAANFINNFAGNFSGTTNFTDNLADNNTMEYPPLPHPLDDLEFHRNMCIATAANIHPAWVPTMTSIIAITGLIFNAIAIFVIIVLKDFRKSISHWYVLQLAIADSIFLAMLPLRILQDIRGVWSLPPIFCKMYQGFFMLNYYSGIFFLTVMSFDRFVAIVHPVSAPWRRFRTHGNAVLISIGVWILSIVVSLPLWIFAEVKCVCTYTFPFSHDEFAAEHGIDAQLAKDISEEDPYEFKFNEDYDYYNGTLYDGEYDLGESHGNWASCIHKPYASFKAWVYGNFIVAFILPVLIMTICYSLILWRVLHPAVRSVNRSTGGRKSDGLKRTSLLGSVRSSSSSSSGSSGSRQGGLTQKQRVTTIVISLVIIFIMCWLPFHINLIMKFQGHPYSHHTCVTINDVTSMLAFANSMLNPIFYTFLGSRFHRRLTSATLSFFRGRSSARVNFSYSRTSRVRASSSVRSAGGNPTKTGDGHQNFYAGVSASKPPNHIEPRSKRPRQRHLSTAESDASDHQVGQEMEMELLKK